MPPTTAFIKDAEKLSKVIREKGDNLTFGKFTKSERTEIGATLRNHFPEMIETYQALLRPRSEKPNPKTNYSFESFANEVFGFPMRDEGKGENQLHLFKFMGFEDGMTLTHFSDTFAEFKDTLGVVTRFLILETLKMQYAAMPASYKRLIRSEETINALSGYIPAITGGDMRPKEIKEGETMPMGSINFAAKRFAATKYGRGFYMTDEAKDFIPYNLTSLASERFLTDLNFLRYNQAVSLLLNGEGGADVTPTTGVAAANVFSYADMLRVWVRMARLANGTDNLIFLMNEKNYLATLNLEEFKKREAGTALVSTKSTVRPPSVLDIEITDMLADTQIMVVDSRQALNMYNVKPLAVEEQRNASNQTSEMYWSLTYGFGTLFRPARLLVNLGSTNTALPTDLTVPGNFVAPNH